MFKAIEEINKETGKSKFLIFNDIIYCGFKYQAGRPLDVRTTVENTVERDELISSNAAYLGMRVYVKSVDKSYYYTTSGWKEVPIGAMYTHPSTHPATMITEDTNHRFMTDAERTKLQSLLPAVALTRAEYEALKESGDRKSVV